MSEHAARRGRQRTDTAKFGEAGVVAEPLGVVPRRYQERSGCVWAHEGQDKQDRRIRLDQRNIDRVVVEKAQNFCHFGYLHIG
jgi:hypothetical protein